MNVTGGSVEEFISRVAPAVRQRDARTMIDLLRRVTGMEPALWGSIVGFGACHYVYPTGTQGDMPLAAFSPRTASTTIYLMEGFAEYAPLLESLGPHSVSTACLYITDLSKVDLAVVETLVRSSFELSVGAGFPGMSLTVTDGPKHDHSHPKESSR